MHIIHLSAECYPVAKVGGLADVVGALPKYLNKQADRASVVIPKYANSWMADHEFETVFESQAPLGDQLFNFRILKEIDDTLGFPFYVVDIPERFDRPGNYVNPDSGSGTAEAAAPLSAPPWCTGMRTMGESSSSASAIA